MVCTFNHYAGYAGSMIDPPEPEQAEIESITIGGIEAFDLFTQEQLWEIEEKLLEDYRGEREAALCDYYDNLRKERALERE